MNHQANRGWIKDAVTALHLSKTAEWFCALGAIVLQEARELGEAEFADWFGQVYIQPNGPMWFAGAFGGAGFVPTNNPVESFNKMAKGMFFTKSTQLAVCIKETQHKFARNLAGYVGSERTW